MSTTGRRILTIAAMLVGVLIAMALLYMLGMEHLEDKPRTFWQALQWAAGTTSTTGYSVDTSWKHPAMVVYVVVAQFIGVALFFAILPTYLIPFLEARFETRLPQDAGDVRGHVVVFDHDATVATLLDELAAAGIPSVVIDEDEAVARHLHAHRQRVVYGNLDEGVLARCNLREARALIVNSSDDRDAAAIMAARQLGYAGEIVAVVEDPFHRHPMLLAGASEAYTPRHVLGAALAARASPRLSPTIAGLHLLGDGVEVAEARIVRDGSLAGRTFGESGLDRVAGATVVGQWVSGRLVTPPHAGLRLEPGAILVILGTADALQSVLAAAPGLHRLRRDGPFIIGGGGVVGHKVAELLADAGERTFVIDRAEGPGVDLVGNMLDTRLLERAGVAGAQAAILAPSADSTAIFGTVIVKDLAPDVPVIARVNRAENVPRLYAAGADFALSVSEVSGQLLAYRLLGRESVAAGPGLRVARIAAGPLAGSRPRSDELRVRTGCTVVAVERDGGRIVAPPDDDALRADDVVCVCGAAEALRRLDPPPRAPGGAH